MAGEQVTVAELLARRAAEAKAKGEEEGTRPRRRRRSLEEGGMSVAELTGSIPVVERAEQHSTNEFEAVEVEAETVEEVDVVAPVVDGDKPEVIEADAVVIEDVEDEPAAYVEDSAAFTQVEQETGWATFPDPTPQPAPEASVEVEPEVPVEAESAAGAVPVVEPSTEMRFDFSHEDGEESVQPQAGAEHLEVSPPPAVEVDDVAVETPQAPVGLVEEVPAEAQAQAEVQVETEAEVEDGDKEKVSVPVIIGESIVGMLVGVGIVKGFEVLWSNFPSNVITAILALVVTFVIVGVVHAVVRTHDKLLMVLAFFVGLVLTFGPLLLVG